MKFFDHYRISFIGLIFFSGICCAMSSSDHGDIEQQPSGTTVSDIEVCPICLANVDEPATSDIPPYVDCTCWCGIKKVCLLGVDSREIVIGKVNNDPKRCNHKVHYRCLLGWQREHGNVCPICGAPSFCILADPSIKCFDRCQKALYWIPATILLGGVLTFVCLFIVRSV